MIEFELNMKRVPKLDPEFAPAALWNKAYQAKVSETPESEDLIIALERPNGSVSINKTRILPHQGENTALNVKYLDRLLKFLLWMKGGQKITIAGGSKELFDEMTTLYSSEGKRAFDSTFIGNKIYGNPLEFIHCSLENAPQEKEIEVPLGGNLDGCRIGFDLGGSDRKCAAIQDGEVVFSEEIAWDPYFEKDPSYHLEGIQDTLKRAADKLPRVDAIGGSSAGCYVDNQVRAASLFRGVSDEDFQKRVVNMFNDIQKEWNVPLIVINDGEVTALAGAMEMNDNAVLGVSMGTSEAAGYVTPSGHITDWLNELAFAPVDYRDDAPVDEWSQAEGCGVQYFSQQAVARLAPAAGLDFPSDMPFPERLVEVQKLMSDGDEKAKAIYETIGIYFGYSIAHYAEFYDIRNLLILGRVTSGEGGDMILSVAQEVLEEEFPELAKTIQFRTPDEKNKRHGQAVAAASLPSIAS